MQTIYCGARSVPECLCDAGLMSPPPKVGLWPVVASLQLLKLVGIKLIYLVTFYLPPANMWACSFTLELYKWSDHFEWKKTTNLIRFVLEISNKVPKLSPPAPQVYAPFQPVICLEASQGCWLMRIQRTFDNWLLWVETLHFQVSIRATGICSLHLTLFTYYSFYQSCVGILILTALTILFVTLFQYIVCLLVILVIVWI